MRVYEIRKIPWSRSKEDTWVADFAEEYIAKQVAQLLNENPNNFANYIVCEEERYDRPFQEEEESEWPE